MTLTIDLPPEHEARLKSKAQAAGLSAERYVKHVLQRDLAQADGSVPSPDDRPLRVAADMILERMRKLPPESFEGLPTDGASQHDHYIYGTPKREP